MADYPLPLLQSGLKLEVLDRLFGGYLSDDEQRFNGWGPEGYWEVVRQHVRETLGNRQVGSGTSSILGSQVSLKLFAPLKSV